jgi:hypothetical protein
MGLFTWIKGLLQPQEGTIRVNCQTMPLAKWKRNGGYQPCSHGGTPNPPPSDFDDHLDREIARCRGSNAPLSFDEWLATPPPKIAAAINRHLDREIAALLAFAEGRQQAQSLQLPPPGADPVATDEDLIVVATGPVWSHHAYRTLYEKGRADERTAIFRALGVKL